MTFNDLFDNTQYAAKEKEKSLKTLGLECETGASIVHPIPVQVHDSRCPNVKFDRKVTQFQGSKEQELPTKCNALEFNVTFDFGSSVLKHLLSSIQSITKTTIVSNNNNT